MNTTRFAPLLERTSRALDLPAAETAQILDELAADAADMFDHLRSRGVDEAVAVREVERWLATRPDSIRELRSIHLPLHLRWAERLSRGGHTRVELVVLCGMVAALTVTAFGLVPNTALMSAPAWAVWTVVTAGAIVVAVTIEHVVAFRVRRQDRQPSRRGLLPLMLAMFAAPAVALLGAGSGFAGVATRADASMAGWQAVAAGAALLAAGLVVALLAAAAWLFLEARARRLERTESSWKEARP